MSQAISQEVLDSSVTGVNLMPGSLRSQLGPETILVFLRHFGCMFCRETVADLRAASEKDPEFPKVLFFFQGTATEGRAFMRRYWPQAHAVADPNRELYEAFGLERGGLHKMFGPGVWSAKRRAEAKGLSNGDRSGDIWMMPGLFLVEGDSIVWAHEFRHAADHPDFARIPELARDASSHAM